MIKLLINISFVILFCIIWVVVSLIASIYGLDKTLFERSGAILALGGTALAVRRLLRMGSRNSLKTNK